jgi:hypothetical protein
MKDLSVLRPLIVAPLALSISFFLENFEMNSDFLAMLLQPSVDGEKIPQPAKLSELEIEAIEMLRSPFPWTISQTGWKSAWVRPARG